MYYIVATHFPVKGLEDFFCKNMKYDFKGSPKDTCGKIVAWYVFASKRSLKTFYPGALFKSSNVGVSKRSSGRESFASAPLPKKFLDRMLDKNLGNVFDV